MLRWEELSRRDFFKISGSGISLLASSCSSPTIRSNSDSSHENKTFVQKFGPVDRTVDFSAKQSTYSGDDNRRPHSILWDVDGYMAKTKVSFKEETNLVIVGGGASGLFSAYQFKEYQPIVLEQARRFGGNAKAESWKGLDYCMGSAYLDAPQKGTPMYDFYTELGLKDVGIIRNVSDPVEFKGRLYRNFWDGETEPEHKEKYVKMHHLFESIFKEEERAFPFIPSLTDKHLESVKYYDQWTLHEFLTKYLDGIPPHLETALEHYCYSTYASSAKELSAAAALNFLSQELDPVSVAPGGNAGYAEKVLKKILERVPAENLRSSSIVVKVKVEGDYTYVYYEDSEGKLHEIKAKAAVLCCPKFVVKNILEGIEDDRLTIINKLKFRSYMTANLLLNKMPSETFYDLFMVDEGRLNQKSSKKHSDQMNATDIIMANFASPAQNTHSVLTFYRAFPHDEGRGELFQKDSYLKQKAKFERQITKKILPLLKLKKTDIADLRLTLWGHAFPVAVKGFFKAEDFTMLRRPFKEKVFFAEQDNWAYPSFHTGATEIALFKDKIQAILDA